MQNLKVIEFQTLRNMTWGYEFNENLWLIDEHDAQAIANEQINHRLFTVYRLTENFDEIEVNKLAGYAILVNTPIDPNEITKMGDSMILPSEWDLGDTWYLNEIVVAPEFRESGVYSELIGKVINYAERNERIEDIYLTAMSDKMQRIMKKKRKKYNGEKVVTTDFGPLWRIHIDDEEALAKRLKIKRAKALSLKIFIWILAFIQAAFLAKHVTNIGIMPYAVIQAMVVAVAIYICAIIEE